MYLFKRHIFNIEFSSAIKIAGRMNAERWNVKVNKGKRRNVKVSLICGPL